MKKFSVIMSVVFLGMFLVAGSAMATNIYPISWDGAGKDLQSLLNSFAQDGDIDLDASGPVNDAIALDEIWIPGGVGSSVALLFEISGNSGSNSFGIYDPFNVNNFVQIFSGSETGYSSKQLLVGLDGSIGINGIDTFVDFTSRNIAFYLDTPNGRLFSESARNTNGTDMMVTFGPGDGQNLLFPAGTFSPGVAPWLSGEYILAWEDLYGVYSDTPAPGASDFDYNDMILMVESIQPVPEPATMLLLGFGLIGLAGASRKKLIK